MTMFEREIKSALHGSGKPLGQAVIAMSPCIAMRKQLPGRAPLASAPDCLHVWYRRAWHDEPGAMLGGAGEPRCGGRRQLCLGRAHDRDLLPAGLRLAAAAAREWGVLRDSRGGRSRRLSP